MKIGVFLRMDSRESICANRPDDLIIFQGWFLAERIFRGFFFLSRRISSFCRRIFSPHFVGQSAQKNPPGKSPAKSSKVYTTKIADIFLQRGRANIFSGGHTVPTNYQKAIQGKYPLHFVIYWGRLLEHSLF